MARGDGGVILDAVGIWSHAAAALLYAALAIWQARRPGDGTGRRALVVALATTAGWALSVMMRGPHDLVARLAEGGRDFAWLGYMYALYRDGGAAARTASPVAQPMVRWVYIVLVATIGLRAAVDLFGVFAPADRALAVATFSAAMLLRITTTLGALVLIRNLYAAAAPHARWGIRLTMIALTMMWAYDLDVYLIAWGARIWPHGALSLRGVLMLALVPLFAVAGRRQARFAMALSRSAAFRSLSLLAIGGYLVAMAALARLLERIGGEHAPAATITLVFAMSIGAMLFAPSRWMRGWLRVVIAKHLFRHRYDYRTEWLRFTDTLGRPGADAAPLDMRAIKAIADITESPGGLLLLPDEDGGLTASSRWNWPTLAVPARAADAVLVAFFEDRQHIMAFDEARAGTGEGASLIPDWVRADPTAWAAVPLLHGARLVGVVVLARPWPDRTMDWEDYDLLRVAGRQVASYLAEARGQEALSDARRFDEFNRRFAFIMHDIKNLVSQLALLTRNAERHADNPDFRTDMIETLRCSTARMNDLLARLSQHHRAAAAEPRPVALGAILDGIAAARRGTHPIEVGGRRDIVADADAARLEQAIGHLVQNAADASPPDAPVWLRIGQRGMSATIEVIDHGHGMSAAFVRTGLFKPFASTKPGGFGIGAFEARALVMAMGGRMEVESREGEGSRFTIVLPLADADARRAVA